jgi:membrane-associated protein
MSLIAVLGLNPEKLLNKYGLIGLALIVFAESGLFIGFFLPGDSLLFTAGLLSALNTGITQPIWVVCAVAMIAAVLGDQVGYQFGKRVGPELFDRPKSKLFRPSHVVKAHEFFEKHGPKTIIMARFVPIVRTFAPMVAGVGQMKYRTFAVYNVVGGALWGVGVTLIGFFLGKRFPSLKDRIDILALVIVAVSLMPVAFEIIKHRRAAKIAPKA